jgi:hypothetical protein
MEHVMLQLFEELLPSTFDLGKVEGFPWEDLKCSEDGMVSFLDNEEALEAWLCDAVEDMKASYLDPRKTRHRIVGAEGQKPSIAAFNMLLNRDRKFQNALVPVVATNCGVSARATLMADLTYCSDGMEEPNLAKILNAVAMVGGKQKAEWRKEGIREFVMRVLHPLL